MKKIGKREEKILLEVVEGKRTISSAAKKIGTSTMMVYVRGFHLLKANYNNQPWTTTASVSGGDAPSS